MAKYETLQAILQEAGMSHPQLAETPYGTADGSNKAFTTQHKPLSDTNHDDVVDANDVLVLINGVPAAVTSVDDAKGIITLTDAPEAEATVTVEYRYSAISMVEATQLRSESQQWLDDMMRQAGDCAPYENYDILDEDNQPHPTVRAITRLYAAAQLLVRDYGYNQDTELTSKDGFKKLELINGSKKEPGMIAKFIATGGVCGAAGENDVSEDLAADSAGDLFGKFEEGARPNSDTDDNGSNF